MRKGLLTLIILSVAVAGPYLLMAGQYRSTLDHLIGNTITNTGSGPLKTRVDDLLTNAAGEGSTGGLDKGQYVAKVDNGKVEVVIGLSDLGRENYPELIDLIVRNRGVVVDIVSFGDRVEAIVVDTPLDASTTLREEVCAYGLSKYVEPNRRLQAAFLPNDPYWSRQWSPSKVEADYAWNTTLGNRTILVAVIDTGVDYDHSDLAANYRPWGYDWVNDDEDPMDDDGHGTHVAGIIGAIIDNSVGIAGLANISIMAEKVLNASGIGSTADLANAIAHAVDKDAHILCMSLGFDEYSETVQLAVRNAYEKGVLIVAAAGNDETSQRYYPAAYDEVIGVTATDRDDNPAKFTNFGDWVEVAAPGVGIYSTNLTTYDDGYAYMDGTSMSAAHVAGVAALIWSWFQDLNGSQVRGLIRDTVDDLGDPGFDKYYGYGRVNARRAIEQSLIIGRTFVGCKPVHPVRFVENQIPVGGQWNITYTLKNESVYHAYFYGSWINGTTDYDVFVYGPDERLLASYTEFNVLPDNLGLNDQPLFTPPRTGNYTFMIRNDPKESRGAENGTFMLIEHIEPNRWYEEKLHMVGMDEKGEAGFNTTWAYEFNTTSRRVEVWIGVPDTLDMLEARLYLVSDPAIGLGTYLPPHNVPLAWEPALYGRNVTVEGEPFGGYNLNSTGHRGNAYATCERKGQDMLINYTSPFTGNLLYHLVFIAEEGFGDVGFMVKTDLTPRTIHSVYQTPSQPEFNERVKVSANITDPEADAFLIWFNGTSWNVTAMSLEGGLFVATMPPLPFNTNVKYYVNASDRVPDLTGRVDGYTREWTRSADYSYTVGTHIVIDRATVSDERCDVGSNQTVRLHAVYAHNGSGVSGGIVYLNGTGYTTNETGWASLSISYDSVGRRQWSVTNVSCYGITRCVKNVSDPRIVWDLVMITLSVSRSRVDVGSNASLTWVGTYEYDGSGFAGGLLLNGTTAKKEAGIFSYSVGNITDPAHGLSVFVSNTVSVIFDRVRIIQGGVSSAEMIVGETGIVWFKAVYEYDGEMFDDSRGALYVNGSGMSWSSEKGRWEYAYTPEEEGVRAFAVSGSLDNQWGLTTVYDAAGVQTISWIRPLWMCWWFWVAVGVVGGAALWVMRRLFMRR